MPLRPQLSSIRARFGYPYHQWTTQDLDEEGWDRIQRSLARKRAYDVSTLIEGLDGRFLLMSWYGDPPGIFRSPRGIVKPGEDIAGEALREAGEETGLAVALKQFLFHATLDIGHKDEVATWDSFIFYGTTPDAPS